MGLPIIVLPHCAHTRTFEIDPALPNHGRLHRRHVHAPKGWTKGPDAHRCMMAAHAEAFVERLRRPQPEPVFVTTQFLWDLLRNGLPANVTRSILATPGWAGRRTGPDFSGWERDTLVFW